jgi:UDP-N-acetylglucosamine--N-acetylmuramyl-(pentapeptide) pyrophosphoryl-undecaprenol N-acetylglucosamine transferase
LNPDAVPGKANQYLARHVEAIFTQFESTRRRFPPRLQGKVRPVGCPIRAGLLGADRAEAIRHFELDAARKTLLVFGASLGAASINEAIIALAADLEALAEQWQVIHVSGPEKLKEVAVAWRSRPIAVKAVEYCNRMDLAYAAADLALCRSGAGAVAELAATATPAILMPYPYHKDQQQRHNAAPLASSGAAVLCEDTKDPSSNARALREVLLPLLKDPPRLETMRQAARGLAKPRAAQDVAKWLVGVEANP